MFNETVFNYSGEVEDAKTRDTVEVQVDSKEATRPEVQNQHPEDKDDLLSGMDKISSPIQ